MNYQVGNTGRVIVIKFDDGENPLKGIAEIAKKENIRSAVFWLVGGLKEGRFVVGPKTEQLPPEPMWRQLKESHEIIGIGTIFWHKDEPKIHLHGAYGKGDHLKMGCLREDPKVFLVLEAIVMEITNVNITREFDAVSKMVLLKI